ncbi:MAG: hypothetical protein KJ065_01200 [Anaerolineae bacterium]|nr:hypothetical protein [Anaerolineae bacterium]
MLRGLQTLTPFQRRVVFFFIFGGVILLLILLTLVLIALTIRVDRSMAVALLPDAQVAEYVALPDDDAYLPTVAAMADDTLFTGSYATGVVWQITPDLTVTEIPNTREQIGGVSGIAVLMDGTLVVVDNGDTDPRTAGGAVWSVTLDGQVTTFAALDDERGWVAPDDAAVDAQGYVYISDRGRNEIWRFDADGANGAVWWVPPMDAAIAQRAITGLAYDSARDAIIVTDPEANDIFRVLIAEGETEVLYRHGERPNPPGFDGVTVTPDGMIYVAALGQNGIARVEDGDLDYIAGLFRGSSDVAYANDRLFVANFDQTSLVVPLYRPSLPFALDVIQLPPDSSG